MSYTLDKSLEFCNTLKFKTESGVEYAVNFVETAQGSGVWTFSLNLISGTPNKREVFQTISYVHDIITDKGSIIEKNNISNILVSIDAKDDEEVEKKTKAFTRWIKKPWSYKVIKNPTLTIEGALKNIYVRTNVIHMFKTNEPITSEVVVKKEEIKNIPSQIKFCYNCGLENNNYKFCPGCGTNLQQA